MADINQFRCSGMVSSPGFIQSSRFTFPVERCRRQEFSVRFHDYLTKLITRKRRFRCNKSRCQISRLELTCARVRRNAEKTSTNVKNQRKSRRGRNDVAKRRRRLTVRSVDVNNGLMRVKFDVSLRPGPASVKCNISCVRKRTRRKLKRTITKLRRAVNRGNFKVKYYHSEYTATQNSFRLDQLKVVCPVGTLLVDSNCVGCSTGTYHNESSGRCVRCSPGWYQDWEGQTKCKPCTGANSTTYSLLVSGAQRDLDCVEADTCEAGTFSPSGRAPCSECPVGSYQPEPGRTSCVTCINRTKTSEEGARSFTDCLINVFCGAGSYYTENGTCSLCPRGSYQPEDGQNHCLPCPGNTTTDRTGSLTHAQCKDHSCGGYHGRFTGYIQSPNYPGNYPDNVECTWLLKPDKGRRLLIVVPEIYLTGDKCSDRLVMRKSASPYSVVSYESCSRSDRPIAFTARSRRLWIRFKSDGNQTDRGFRIPYVTYNEEYQDLIESIVKDGRLYSLYQHQQIFKDRQVLSALLEVIATPYNYFKYSNMTRTMFPKSFIRLLAPKVRQFFSE